LTFALAHPPMTLRVILAPVHAAHAWQGGQIRAAQLREWGVRFPYGFTVTVTVALSVPPLPSEMV
jgi:hypothetical protein